VKNGGTMIQHEKGAVGSSGERRKMPQGRFGPPGVQEEIGSSQKLLCEWKKKIRTWERPRPRSHPCLEQNFRKGLKEGVA